MSEDNVLEMLPVFPAVRCGRTLAHFPALDPPRRMRVYCREFASCRWNGVRLVSRLGGKDVLS